MLYYFLGIVVVLMVNGLLALLKSEKKIKMTGIHILMSIMISMYLVYVIEKLHDINSAKLNVYFKFLVMFIPFGIIMPMIYNKFKHFLVNIWYALAVSGLIILMQKIVIKKIYLYGIIFALVGDVIGFIICKTILSLYPGIRANCVIKFKNKKHKNKLAMHEIEYISAILAVIFLGTSVMEAALNNTGSQANASASESEVGESLDGSADNLNTYGSDYVSSNSDKYAEIYYADADKYERYDAYAAEHPEFSIEDVVWRVDANLDQEFYDENYIQYADADTDEPFLINKFNRVSDDYVPSGMVTIEGSDQATAETARAYKRMTADMADEGMKLYVVSAYRSVKYQKNLHNKYLKKDTEENVDTYSAKAGFSEHHTGRALDISQVSENLDAFEGSEEADWVYENCYKYGFIVRYKDNVQDITGYIFEPWHITYVGTEASNIMHDENIDTLEEYVVKYVDHQKP